MLGTMRTSASAPKCQQENKSVVSSKTAHYKKCMPKKKKKKKDAELRTSFRMVSKQFVRESIIIFLSHLFHKH